MINIVVLVGPSNCGKDYLRKYLVDKYDFIQYLKPYTTREKRDNESEDDYYFNYFPEGFDIMEKRSYEMADGKTVEYATIFPRYVFDDRIYLVCGTIEMLINIISVLFNDIEKSLMWSGKKVKVNPIFIKADPNQRLLKAVERMKESGEDPDEVCRRFIADSKDFSDWKIKEFNERYKSIDRKYLSNFVVIQNNYSYFGFDMCLSFANIFADAGFSFIPHKDFKIINKNNE